jgi:deferrochelatase/peroxidase EfeB
LVVIEPEQAEHAFGVVDVGVGRRVAVEHGAHDAEQRAAGGDQRGHLVWDAEAAGFDPALEVGAGEGPYFGTHAILEITDAAAGKELLRRLEPRVTTADRWDEPQPSWLALALSYQGLVALGLPETSLASFPSNFRTGMAARADRLRDVGANAPKRWERPFGTPQVHVGVSIHAESDGDWRSEVAAYERQLRDVPGVRLLSHQDFGATGSNVFGYRDGFTQPVVEGSGAEPLPGDGRPIKAGEFVLGYLSETGQPLPMPTPEVLGRNGTYVVFRKYHSHVAAFNRYLRDNARSEQERELLAAKLVGRWRSGAPLALSPAHDDPALGQYPTRINDFDYADDPRGLRTPLGSHIRRMNPRATKLQVLSDINIRRGSSATTAGRAAWTTSRSARAPSTTSSSCRASGSTPATSWASARRRTR